MMQYRKNGIRTHDIKNLYVDLANQYFKPLSHFSYKILLFIKTGFEPVTSGL